MNKAKGAGPSRSDLQGMAEAIMPRGVVAVCRDVNGDITALHAEERLAVERAVNRRQAEFAAGRLAAHAALQQLGQSPQPIPAGADRAPIWPDGFTGSISHCHCAVIAIAARLDHTRRHLGVDVEAADGLETDLWDSVCGPNEIAWLQARPSPALRAKVLFSIKEAVYKAQFPLTGMMLDFHDIEVVDLDPDGSFTAYVLPYDMKKVTGRFQVSDLFILAFAMSWQSDR